jgi:hypothetical protein
MSKDRKGSTDVSITVGGDVSGQLAVGQNIRQARSQVGQSTGPSEGEIGALLAQFEELKATIEAQVPENRREAALERVEELREAIVADEPDLGTMEYVKGWFARNLPTVAGAVTSVVVNPIVGKLVSAAGDALVEEFDRRFGRDA